MNRLLRLPLALLGALALPSLALPAGAANDARIPAQEAEAASLPQVVDLGAAWRFLPVTGRDLPVEPALDDLEPSLWRRVNLPVEARDWLRTADDAALDAAAESAGSAVGPGGRGWYEKRLLLNSGFAGLVQQLYFDGVDGQADVYLDGVFLFTQRTPGVPFRIEVSGLLASGREHALRVLVRPGPGRRDSGGLLGGVRLWIAGPLRLAGGSDPLQPEAPEPIVALTGVDRGPQVSWTMSPEGQPRIHLRTKVVNSTLADQPFAVVHQVFDENEQVLAFARSKIENLASGSAIWNELEADFPELEAWRPLEPRRVRVETALYGGTGIVDSHITWTAPRAATFTASKGWTLAGETYRPVGVLYRPELPSVGRALSGPALRRDLVRIGQMGAEWLAFEWLPEMQALRQCSTMGLHAVVRVPAKPTPDHAAYFLAVGHQPSLIGVDISNTADAEDVQAWRDLLDGVAPGLVVGGAFEGSPWSKLPSTSEPQVDRNNRLDELRSALIESAPGPLWIGSAFASASGLSAMAEDYRTPTWSLHALRGRSLQQRVGWAIYPATDWLPGSKERTVEVFTNCPEVGLWLNGEEIGRVKNAGNEAGWGVRFEGVEFAPGELRAVGYSAGEPVVGRSVRTPSKPASITCVADLMGVEFQGGAADAVVVHGIVLDEFGQRVVGFDGEVTFRVRGSGEIVGAHRVRARDGVASVTVRGLGRPGAVNISADAPELRGGDAAFNAL